MVLAIDAARRSVTSPTGRFAKHSRSHPDTFKLSPGCANAPSDCPAEPVMLDCQVIGCELRWFIPKLRMMCSRRGWPLVRCVSAPHELSCILPPAILQGTVRTSRHYFQRSSVFQHSVAAACLRS